jgi:DNA/RNA-binding domain of Phe-tRNA-synthetase-like protein
MESQAGVLGMPSVTVTAAWQAAFPDARVGMLLVDNVTDAPPSAALLRRARMIETELRERYAGADRAALASLPAAQAYQRHYRAFGQTYHVLRQLESVALKSKSLTGPSGLVLAMFAVELESLLLTAGHDADVLQPPLIIDRSLPGDTFVGIGGREHTLREGDMLIRDQSDIISAVIYGPDQRTRLTDQTRRALFTTYAPAGISIAQVNAHLDGLAEMLGLASPSVEVRLRAIYPS